MKPKTIYKYIFFGTAIRYLQDAHEGMPIQEKSGISDNINSVFQYLDEFDLPVTKRATFQLGKFSKNLKQLNSHRLTTEQAKDLKEIMRDLRKIIDAEARGNFAYIVTDKRIDIQKLLSNPSALMAPNTFKSLPPIAKKDFTEAGRCIAFELPTAAAFHLLRGTEDVLRKCYFYFTKRNRIKDLTWGSILKDFERRKKRPTKALLCNLDNIKNNFRNPTDSSRKNL